MNLGVKSHWRDLPDMAAIAREAGAGTLEIHLAERDLADDADRARDAFRAVRGEFRLVAHQPEWVETRGRAPLFVDPAAPDPAIREASRDALVEAARFARDVGAVALVVHPGGIALPRSARGGDAAALRATLAETRAAVPDVPLWMENMPWFYGWRGGVVGRSTIGRVPGDAVATVAPLVDGWCLDLCHAFLSAPPPGGGWDAVEGFLLAWGPRISHAHASGALRAPAADPAPQRGEGVPFTEGEMDAATYGSVLRRLPRAATVVPEIKDGFRERGRGFRDALAWLRALERT